MTPCTVTLCSLLYALCVIELWPPWSRSGSGSPSNTGRVSFGRGQPCPRCSRREADEFDFLWMWGRGWLNWITLSATVSHQPKTPPSQNLWNCWRRYTQMISEEGWELEAVPKPKKYAFVILSKARVVDCKFLTSHVIIVRLKMGTTSFKPQQTSSWKTWKIVEKGG